MTGTYDPALNLIYWGTGNPSPDFYGDNRKGDNLYSGSLIALDADTGTLKWHFQFTPHDTHDWDANQIPVLADLTLGGRLRKVVMVANRNGFFYVTARETCMVCTSEAPPEGYKAGGRTMGGRVKRPEPGHGGLRAIDPATGERKWELKHPTPSWPIFVTETACEGFFGPFVGISPLPSIRGCPIRDVV